MILRIQGTSPDRIIIRSGDFLFPDETYPGGRNGFNRKNALQDDNLSDQGLGYLSIGDSGDYLDQEIAAVTAFPGNDHS